MTGIHGSHHGEEGYQRESSRALLHRRCHREVLPVKVDLCSCRRCDGQDHCPRRVRCREASLQSLAITSRPSAYSLFSLPAILQQASSLSLVLFLSLSSLCLSFSPVQSAAYAHAHVDPSLVIRLLTVPQKARALPDASETARADHSHPQCSFDLRCLARGCPPGRSCAVEPPRCQCLLTRFFCMPHIPSDRVATTLSVPSPRRHHTYILSLLPLSPPLTQYFGGLSTCIS